MEYFRKKPNQNQGVPFSLFRGASVAERNLSGGCFGKEGHGRRAGEVPKSQAACLRRGRGDLDLRRKGTHAGAVWWWEGYILPKPLKGPPRQSGAAREEQGRVEQNFFSVPLARTAERRQTSITSSRNTKGDAPMGIAFWWWEEVDSNYRSRRRQIYSLIHLAALESSRMKYKTGEWLRVGVGAGDWNRTHNLLITNQLLCQLSYTTTDTGIFSPLLYRLSYRGILKPAWQPTYAIKQASSEKVATRNGLEPSTSSVTGWRSNQLNYRAVI